MKRTVKRTRCGRCCWLDAVIVVGMLMLAACGDDSAGPPTGPGQVDVTTVTTGAEIDADGYSVRLDGGSPAAIAASGSTIFQDVAAGSHEVVLEGIAANCTESGDNPRTVQVAAGAIASTTFVLTCAATTGTLEVETATSGLDLDDGYEFQVNGGGPQVIAGAAVVAVQGIAAGTATVQLSGVASNCTVAGENPRSVDIVAGGTVRTRFDVSCAPVAGDLRIVTSTTGSQTDDAYTAAVDGGTPASIGAADTLLVGGLDPGDHSVFLNDVAANCAVAGENPRTVSVIAGAVSEARFDVSCAAEVGSVRVTTDTWGLGLDTGYEVAVTGVPSTAISANATVTIGAVPAGDVTVELMGIAGNCTVQGENPVSFALAADATMDVSFPVFCFESLSNRIVFESDRAGGEDDLWVMTATGGSPTRLTRFEGFEREPDVAPDGSAVVFEQKEVGGSRDIWILDDSGIRDLSAQVGIERSPSFSGNGQAVAYAWRSSSSTWEIWRINRDGSGQTRVMSPADAAVGDDDQPAWSPDGNWIAFRSDRDDRGNFDIYVMDSSGGNIRRLTTDPTEDGKPAWSPDGTRITWSSNRDGSFDVWRADIEPATGILTNLRDLTPTANWPGTDGKSDWRPGSSNQIAFAGDSSGDNEIYTTADAAPGQPLQAPVNLTQNPADDVEPSWSP